MRMPGCAAIIVMPADRNSGHPNMSHTLVQSSRARSFRAGIVRTNQRYRKSLMKQSMRFEPAISSSERKLKTTIKSRPHAVLFLMKVMLAIRSKFCSVKTN